jgi:hypothetical protein
MLQFTSGVNDVELSLELAATAMNVATGHYYDEYGEAYAQQMGFRHSGFLRPGGNLVMKVYEVRGEGWGEVWSGGETHSGSAWWGFWRRRDAVGQLDCWWCLPACRVECAT